MTIWDNKIMKELSYIFSFNIDAKMFELYSNMTYEEIKKLHPVDYEEVFKITKNKISNKDVDKIFDAAILDMELKINPRKKQKVNKI